METGQDVAVPQLVDLTVLADADGKFRAAYGVSGLSAYLIRPDGHVGYRTGSLSSAGLGQHLRLTFADA